LKEKVSRFLILGVFPPLLKVKEQQRFEIEKK